MAYRENRRRTAPRAFTLIELLVTITIIAILAGLILTALEHARTNALKGKARQAISEIDKATDIFKSDFGVLPPLNTGTSDADFLNSSKCIYLYLSGKLGQGGTSSTGTGTCSFLNGAGGGRLFDTKRSRSVPTPLNYADSDFDANLLLRDPWSKSTTSNTQFYYYTGARPSGAPAGKSWYVYVNVPADVTIGNWSQSE